MLSSQGGVGCVVTAVLSVVVAALALLLLTLGKGRVVGAGAESASSTLLSRSSLLLALCLLAVVLVVLLVRIALLLGCKVLRGEVVRCRRECDRLCRGLGCLTGVVVLVRRRNLLAKWIVWLLLGSRGF